MNSPYCGCTLSWGAHRDVAAYAHFRDRYRDMARTLGFEGNIASAHHMRPANPSHPRQATPQSQMRTTPNR